MARLTNVRRQISRARKVPGALSPLGFPIGEPKAKAAREACRRAAVKANVLVWLGPDNYTITVTDASTGITLITLKD